MALPLGTTGSLSSTFVPARLVCLAVNHPFVFALLLMVSNHHEGNFRRLRYFLGGDRPSQTARLTLSECWFHSSSLESQYIRGGIPTAAPQKLTPLYLCLPPILYMTYRDPMPDYSKALRGLSVLSRVTRIFTSTTISPGVLSRQCSNRYAFRAGQNLPDKEFRYLRTVIVTAAVYWGLSSHLRVTAKHSP